MILAPQDLGTTYIANFCVYSRVRGIHQLISSILSSAKKIRGVQFMLKCLRMMQYMLSLQARRTGGKHMWPSFLILALESKGIST